VVNNWKPEIEVDPEWPMMKLGDIITLQRGYDLPKQEWKDGDYPIVGSNGIIGYHNAYKEIGPGVVTGRSGTIGKVHYISDKFYWPHNTSLFVKDFKGNNRQFICYLLQSLDLKSLGERTAAVPSLDRKNAHQLSANLPPLEIQGEIVAKIKAEQKAVDGCRELMIRYEEKIKRVMDGVWG
jgi:restriction endonuclease S subunit